MLEAIQVLRDIVIILAGIVITGMVVLVGRAVLDLVRRAEDLRLFVGDVASGVANPIKGVLLVMNRIARRKGKA